MSTPHGVPPGQQGRVSAEEALTPLWRSLAADLRRAEADLRLDREDSVHEFRVAARRLRSNLAGLSSLLDAKECRALQRQLRDTAWLVSGARDAEVVAARLEQLLAAETAPVERARELVHAVLADFFDRHEEHRIAHLDSEAYDAFTRRLERFADLPPWLPQARGSASETLRPLLLREWTRFRDQMRTAVTATAGPEGDERLHDARKAAKRVRYVAEALSPALGRRAQKQAKVAARVQRVLGTRQDSALTLRVLAEADVRARSAGEDSGVLERMRLHEEAVVRQASEELTRVADEVERKKHRRWLL